MKQNLRHFLQAACAGALSAAMLLSGTALAASFTDVPEDSESYAAVEWAGENGIAVGTGRSAFRPEDPCTLGQLATFLWRLAGAPDVEPAEDDGIPADQWYTDALRWAVSATFAWPGADAGQILRGTEAAVLLEVFAEAVGMPADFSALAEQETALRGGVIQAIYDAFGGDAAAAALDDGSPWVDYDLRENLAAAEKPASPKDDYYLYVNYDLLTGAELKPGYSSANAFVEVADEMTEKGRALLTDETLPGADASLIRQLYSAYLDWDARNALGLEPVREQIGTLQAISSLEELTAYFATPDVTHEGLFGFGNTTGLNDSEHYLAAVQPMGLLLGDSAEYSEMTEMGERMYDAYTDGGVRMLTRLGFSAEEAAAMMASAFEFEGALAEGIMTSEETMRPDYIQRINNEMDRAGLEQVAAVFPLTEILDGWGFGASNAFLVTEPDYFRYLDEVYQPDRLEDIKNYLIVCCALSAIGTTDREAYEASVALSNAVSGSEGSVPDEEAAYQVVRGSLTGPMDRAFLEKYDASQMKQDITRICEEAVAYYRTMLEGEDWLSAETRAKAIEKLDTLTINAVYPEKWRDYSALSLDGLGYYDAMNAIGQFETDYNLSLLNGTVDHEIWDFDILETNAYYNPTENSINIILGILGGVFYSGDMSDEALYAGIGSVIGHEISHAFDTNGAQFDAAGNLNDWWSEEDYAEFEARADALVSYYDGMTAFGGYAVRGESIQSEAIADMTGLKCMLGILEQKGSVDYAEFFRHYAEIWWRVNTREYEYLCLTQDVHPLHYLRTNATVQQFPQFYDAFGIREGDGMYLAPENRVLIW